MPSKAYMARRLVELGHTKSVNTLRRYPAALLAAMLAEREPERERQQPAASVASAPTVPAVVASVASVQKAVPVTRRPASPMAWLALAMLPMRILRDIVGTPS